MEQTNYMDRPERTGSLIFPTLCFLVGLVETDWGTCRWVRRAIYSNTTVVSLVSVLLTAIWPLKGDPYII